MVAYIVRRALLAGFTIFVISFISFVIVTLRPGDYVDWYQRHLTTWGGEGGLSDGQRTLTPDYIKYLREKFWLDRPLVLIPQVVLGTAGTAGLVRVMRNNLLDELGKPYVVTARAMGLPAWRAVVKYPVRVAINPFISGIGSMLPSLVSGSVIVFIVLSLPTLGPTLLVVVLSEDIYLAGVIILMMGILTVVGTLISDIVLVVADPRIKLTGTARGGGGTV